APDQRRGIRGTAKIVVPRTWQAWGITLSSLVWYPTQTEGCTSRATPRASTILCPRRWAWRSRLQAGFLLSSERAGRQRFVGDSSNWRIVGDGSADTCVEDFEWSM